MEFHNAARAPYTAGDRTLIGVEHARRARAHFAGRPGYRPTPVHTLPGLAGTGTVHVKDESGRMGLGSFKALGGAYAVHLLAGQDGGGPPFVCASAGNHGLSVASGARETGSRCVVHLSENVPEAFARRLRAYGADVVRQGRDYEESMAAARRAAREHGWRLVSDSSWDGYTAIPLDVMRGYTVLLDELADPGALGGPAGGGVPTHVFVQAGVGGLAAAAAAYTRDRWGEQPKIVVVEPEGAPCLLESARAGRPVRVQGGHTTLGRLDCAEPSLLAHRLLGHLADLFMTITDDQASAAARLFGERHGIALSGCGAAGAAGLLALTPDGRDALGIDRASRVVLVGTEGPMEPK
ncbi:pyridoxal-phosphate dependent enzyme [Nonomuraea sp. K274]|uniref:Pyridoxal-phosphate dependent enzyme n=1 Tax=Nonomuraea cypriaca TaxID=1187855 RepID=A0A931AK15_9ACTN|nr:pyridoxal-phosphate dependent enzyme [Nonomuraea cypriaca]MBF8192399.1 pyridoxal-phosphate dependent enzyme [Nonomuraea cypriaca]